MLFRPNFCANCGEKVERAEWFPWTSRRFCIVCETEFKGHDLIRWGAIGLCLLVGLIGVGGYLGSGATESGLQAVKQPKKLVEQPSPAVKPPPANVAASAQIPSNLAVNGQPEQRNISSTTGTRPPAQQLQPKMVVDEAVNFCGAETKKGTPCSRRVKGNTRCFQHIGMPAMAVAARPDVRSEK